MDHHLETGYVIRPRELPGPRLQSTASSEGDMCQDRQSSASLGWLNEALRELRDAGLYRELRDRGSPQQAIIDLDGRRAVNFGSNDYLGLAAEPVVVEAVRAALEQYGWGSGASPLVTGHSRLHARLEQALGRFEGTAAALVFPSGYAANCGTLSALAGPGDVIFADRKNHASLWDGCRLSRADVRAYPHGDVDRLVQLLERGAGRYRRRVIVSDALFSMDGDLAPLPALVDLAERYEATLVVDEAHATGVFGEMGRGAVEYFGLEDRVTVRIGTLSKALGSVGGFVVGSQELISWLINRARPYIFSTAAPPATAAAALASLDIVERQPHRRRELLTRAAAVRETLSAAGWRVSPSHSQIIPLWVDDPRRAVALSRSLAERDIFAPAIRPPTVPEGEACVRISLSWAHDASVLDRLLDTLDALRGQFAGTSEAGQE